MSGAWNSIVSWALPLVVGVFRFRSSTTQSWAWAPLFSKVSFILSPFLTVMVDGLKANSVPDTTTSRVSVGVEFSDVVDLWEVVGCFWAALLCRKRIAPATIKSGTRSNATVLPIVFCIMLVIGDSCQQIVKDC